MARNKLLNSNLERALILKKRIHIQRGKWQDLESYQRWNVANFTKKFSELKLKLKHDSRQWICCKNLAHNMLQDTNFTIEQVKKNQPTCNPDRLYNLDTASPFLLVELNRQKDRGTGHDNGDHNLCRISVLKNPWHPHRGHIQLHPQLQNKINFKKMKTTVTEFHHDY